MGWTHGTGENRSRDRRLGVLHRHHSAHQLALLQGGTNPGGQYQLTTGAHAWTYYYNPSSTATFTMTDAASDASGVSAVEFPDLSTTGFTGTGL